MKKYLLMMAAALSAATTFTACSDDDNTDNSSNGSQVTTVDPTEMRFVVAAGDPTSDLTGGVYMKVFHDLSSTKTDQTVYGDDDNATKSLDGFTQYAYNPTTGVYSGYIYARAASAEGIGASQPGIRSYKITDGKLVELANSPVKIENFGNTGYFGNYTYAAQISNPYVMSVDNTGAGNNITLALPNYAIDEVNPTVSNIIDRGDGTLAMVLKYSNRDSACVAFTDYDLNITKVIYSAGIGASDGEQRSVRYPMSGSDDNGNIYVFSGNSATDSKIGALRIKKGATEFDADYKFDILSAADGYRFRKAFHISGDKFLLEFYLTKDAYGNMNTSGKYAVVDVVKKTLTWVEGLPDGSSVSFGWGDGYDGAYYLPVSAATSFNHSGGSTSGGGWNKGAKTRATSTVLPIIYRIDAETGVATSFMTFTSSNLLKSIKILK